MRFVQAFRKVAAPLLSSAMKPAVSAVGDLTQGAIKAFNPSGFLRGTKIPSAGNSLQQARAARFASMRAAKPRF